MSGEFHILGLDGRDRTALLKAGIETLDQLLNHLPKRYEDRRAFDKLPTSGYGQAVCLRGQVLDFRQRHFGARRKYSEAVFVISGHEMALNGRIGLRWFNMPYISNMVAAGMELIIYGKLKDSKNGLVIDHPEFEVVESGTTGGVHIERIVPVYRNIQGIPQRRLREIQWAACEEIESGRVRPFLHPAPRLDRYEQLRSVHFPQELEEAKGALREFALEEFFLLQLNVLWQKSLIKKVSGYSQGQSMVLMKQFYKSMPFDLTGAQKRSIKELIGDLRKSEPMHRLLQGDVGSGKTFVAMCAMLLAVDSGHQAALMAPTQILAEQHYYTFQKWLEPLGVRIALRTGARDEKSFMEMEGGAQIIIGTHALLYGGVEFEDLSLVVIDEQHRFGVEQRRKLITQSKVSPDVLVMTATPIPRTLTLSIYGDLDVSIIDELPAGREKIVSAVRQKPKVTEVTKFLKEHLANGRQAYLVYPLVEDSENLNASSVTTEFDKWVKRLKPYKVGLLHGKMKAEEKDEIMKLFRQNELQVLISTTVIEVGVDVPNANIMLIHDAERFGLAQLHQLRGRVGRGSHKSYCVLISNSTEEHALEKLKILSQTEDGFALAEEDLRMRGPGELLGSAQSGAGDIKFVEFLADINLLKEARELAENVLRSDPKLERHAALLPYINKSEKEISFS